ncbi:MAG TPA: oligosaccharide flippase family protein [Terriglobales bacterium]|nr:oligosaccharide flippase family protein [Terriglobales bacterium]
MNRAGPASSEAPFAPAIEVKTPRLRAAHLWRALIDSDFSHKIVETYATRIFLIGLGLITSVVVSRTLGPTGRGLYAIAAVTGILGVQFGNMGLHTANVYYVAREPQSLPALVGNSLILSFGVGTLISFILGLCLHQFSRLIALHGVLLVLTLMWIPFGLAYLLLQNLMLGMHDVRGYNLLEIVNKSLPLVVILALAIAKAATTVSLFSATVAGLLVTSVWTLFRLQSVSVLGFKVSCVLFRGSIRYALKAYLAALFAFLVLRADLFMVQHMLGLEQAGYYSVASSMADYVSVIAVVIGTLLFPKLSAMQDVQEKLALTQKTTWMTAGLLVPLLLIASLVARPAVRVLFGAAFLPAASAFVLLMPGMLFLGVNSVAVQFLNSIGYPKSVVLVWGLCCCFNIGIDLWAIPHYGISGASVVSSVSYLLACVFILLIIRSVACEKEVEVLP